MTTGRLRTREQWMVLLKHKDISAMARLIVNDLSGFRANPAQDRENIIAAIEAIIQIVEEKRR